MTTSEESLEMSNRVDNRGSSIAIQVPPSPTPVKPQKPPTLDSRMSMVGDVLEIDLKNYGLKDIVDEELDHPVNEAYLTAVVWSQIKKWFWLNIGFYIVYLILLTTSVWVNLPVQEKTKNSTCASTTTTITTITTTTTIRSNNPIQSQLYSTPFRDMWQQGILAALITLFLLLLVVREIGQMWLQCRAVAKAKAKAKKANCDRPGTGLLGFKKGHYFTWDNMGDWISIGVTIFYIVYLFRFIISKERDPNDKKLASSCGALAVLVAWLNLPFYLSELPSVGPMIHFAHDVLRTLIQIIMVLAAPFIIGYGLFFHFEMPSTKSDNMWYHDMLKAVMKMMKNLDDMDYVTKKHDTFPLVLLNEAAMGVFMIVLCLALQNVLLTLTVGRMEIFFRSAKINRMRRVLRAFESFSVLSKTYKLVNWKSLKEPNSTTNQPQPYPRPYPELQYSISDWKLLKVEKSEKNKIDAWKNVLWFFKFMIEAQGQHYQQSCKYLGKLYIGDNTYAEYSIPSWIINKAEEIKKKDIQEEAQGAETRSIKSTQLDMDKKLDNCGVVQVRTDEKIKNMQIAMNDQKRQIDEMHKILVGFEQRRKTSRTELS